MSREEKLEALADILELDPGDISEDTVLEEVETWDSIAVLAVIAFMNENYNRFPSAEEILQYNTVGDLMNFMEPA